jgi:hypothetical protein
MVRELMKAVEGTSTLSIMRYGPPSHARRAEAVNNGREGVDLEGLLLTKKIMARPRLESWL